MGMLVDGSEIPDVPEIRLELRVDPEDDVVTAEVSVRELEETADEAGTEAEPDSRTTEELVGTASAYTTTVWKA